MAEPVWLVSVPLTRTVEAGIAKFGLTPSIERVSWREAAESVRDDCC
jgi:hypothetical protein